MRTHVLHREQRLRGTPAEVFPFFGDGLNLEAITPPLLGFEVITPGPITMRVGTIIQYRLRVHGLSVGWTTSIQEWEPGVRFVDCQIRGPYVLWHHTHTFEDDGAGGTLMRDTVRYAMPFGILGEIAHRAVVRRDLESIFAFRAEKVSALLAAQSS